MWTGSVMVAVASDFVQIDGIERARRRNGFWEGASRRSEAMGAGKEGHHPYPFPFDASEVVGREPGSVATRLGEQEKTTARGLDR